MAELYIQRLTTVTLIETLSALTVVVAAVLVVVYIALAAPYFLIIFYLSPRAVASFVLIHAFKEKSDEVALELQEDLEYAERMGERVKKGIESSGKPYEAVERVFDALDYNKVR